MPSARTPSRVTIPCRSSRSSARARGSGAPGKRPVVPDQRPCVAVIASARCREKRRGFFACLGAAKRRPARSGCQASFVTSPAQTRSQSAGSASSPSSSVSRRRSNQKRAPRESAARMASCASPSGGGSAAGRPSAGASSRKKSAARSSPAPTQTTSPEAVSWSNCAGW
jgi:hypothetical protein